MQVHLLLSPTQRDRQVAERETRQDSRCLRVHLPSPPVSRHPQSSSVQPHLGAALARRQPLPRHGGQVPAEPRQPRRIRRQGELHGSCESFHPQEQRANGRLSRSLVGTVTAICLDPLHHGFHVPLQNFFPFSQQSVREKPYPDEERVKGDPARDLATIHHLCEGSITELQNIAKSQVGDHSIWMSICHGHKPNLQLSAFDKDIGDGDGNVDEAQAEVHGDDKRRVLCFLKQQPGADVGIRNNSSVP